MKRKLIIYLLFIFCIRLFATPTDELYSKILESNERFWIPIKCINVLASNDKNKIKDYYPDIEKLNFYDELEDRNVFWDEFECFSSFCIVPEYDFTNDALCITFGDSESLSFYFSNISISHNKNYYLDIKKTYNCKQLENRHSFSKWPITEDECTMILEFDGDYLNVYLNDLKNYYGTFCKIDKKTLDEYNSLISIGKCDLSRVTWPRHADGTCDYDDEIKPPKVQLSDNDSVYEEEEENATPSDPLSENEEDVKTVEENVPAVKNSSSLPLVIIVVSAVILLLCIVIILIVRKKKKQ